jgi:hypothetical protein
LKELEIENKRAEQITLALDAKLSTNLDKERTRQEELQGIKVTLQNLIRSILRDYFKGVE